jgi:hybrid cluster-associated redox disulfide protein
MSPGLHTQITVAEVLERWPATALVFAYRRMACLGCAMAQFDTIDEAALVYGIDVEGLLGELRRVADEKSGGQA